MQAEGGEEERTAGKEGGRKDGKKRERKRGRKKGDWKEGRVGLGDGREAASVGLWLWVKAGRKSL